MKKIWIIFAVLVLVAMACICGNGSDDSVKEVEPNQTDTQVVVEPTETKIPEQTAWIVFVECPECEGLPLSLWENVGDKGSSPGKVNHGDKCVVLDVGSFEGIERYKINCAGVEGWLRSEGLITP